MAKVKVRVRYPSAFVGLGLGDVQGNDVVEVEAELGKALAFESFADLVEEPEPETKRVKKTETATVKLKDRDA
jgi:hypothetical protein